MKIKNIFWDVDGVLADLNSAYFYFLKNHPKYQKMYADIRWEDLPKVLPIVPKYGALELKTHPTLGTEMDADFCRSPDFFNHRSLYPHALETIRKFHRHGYRQFTMSATFDVEKKKKLLSALFFDVSDILTIECVQHGKFMHDTAKEDMLLQCFDKYGLKAEETVLIDDRIYNQYAALHIGAQPVRFRSEFTTDLPEDLNFIPEVSTYDELFNLLEKINQETISNS